MSYQKFKHSINVVFSYPKGLVFNLRSFYRVFHNLGCLWHEQDLRYGFYNTKVEIVV